MVSGTLSTQWGPCSLGLPRAASTPATFLFRQRLSVTVAVGSAMHTQTAGRMKIVHMLKLQGLSSMEIVLIGRAPKITETNLEPDARGVVKGVV